MSNVPPPPGDEPSSTPPPPPASSTPPPPPPPPPGLTPPPGYAAYQTNPTPSKPIKRVGGLSVAVTSAVIVAAIATAVTAVISAGFTTDASNFLSGSITQSEFEDALAPLASLQILVQLATITTAILTIIWMFRMANNVRSFGRATTWSPLFAIFGWVLPPLLFVIPFLMLRELWKASDDVVDGTDAWKRSPDSPLLWAWFVLFGVLPAVLLVVQVGSLTGGGLPTGDLTDTADALDEFGVLGWLNALFSIGAAIVWVFFVRQLTARHRRLTNES